MRNEKDGMSLKGWNEMKQPLKSKAYVAFLNKAITYERDIEILDVLSHKKLKDSDIDQVRHSKIAQLSMTTQEVSLRTNHLKSTLYEGLVKNGYEIMMWYFHDIVKSILRHGLDPIRIADNNLQPMTIADIIKTGGWDPLCNEITSRIIRGLENLRDTPKAILELTKRLSIDIKPDSLNAAKPYFEIRHLLVHNNGCPDDKFRRDFPEFLKNGEIKLRCENVRAAFKAIKKYVADFDYEIIRKKILADCDCQK